MRRLQKPFRRHKIAETLMHDYVSIIITAPRKFNKLKCLELLYVGDLPRYMLWCSVFEESKMLYILVVVFNKVFYLPSLAIITYLMQLSNALWFSIFAFGTSYFP